MDKGRNDMKKCLIGYKGPWRITGVLLLAVLIFMSPKNLLVQAASGESIDSIDVEVVLAQDGSARVTETLTANVYST